MIKIDLFLQQEIYLKQSLSYEIEKRLKLSLYTHNFLISTT